MIVNEIFLSIDGEGKRAGELAVFIRLAGCNLRCSYCDTAYALTADAGQKMSVDQILSKVNQLSEKIIKNVTLTGGEPLIHKDVKVLIESLMNNYYEVNVETNGSIFPPIPSKPGSLFYTMDFKCLTSNESDKMNHSALTSLTDNDVLKFVVGSIEDLDQMRDVISNFNTDAKIYISPVFGKIDPKDIVAYMIKYRMYNARIQLQLHKFIWDPSERGV